MLGKSTVMRRSNRPGRSKAGSKISGREEYRQPVALVLPKKVIPLHLDFDVSQVARLTFSTQRPVDIHTSSVI